MNNTTALIGLATIASVATYFTLKAFRAREKSTDQGLTATLIAGFLIGIMAGSGVSWLGLQMKLYSGEGSYYAWVVVPPFIGAVVGALAGVFLFLGKEGRPNQAL